MLDLRYWTFCDISNIEKFHPPYHKVQVHWILLVHTQDLIEKTWAVYFFLNLCVFCQIFFNFFSDLSWLLWAHATLWLTRFLNYTIIYPFYLTLLLGLLIPLFNKTKQNHTLCIKMNMESNENAKFLEYSVSFNFIKKDYL